MASPSPSPTMAGIKPMYRTYLSTWDTHAAKYGPRTALLYQVGGFYEIYDVENLTTGTTRANAREIAEVCQLSLTTHAVDDDTQTLFGGVPEGALGKYERILVGAGYTVVVVSQRKGATGAVEERLVEHISSPGCYLEGGGSGRDRRLVGCVLESLTDGPAALRRVYWAATALDVATGGIWFVEGTDRDRLHQFLCLHPPAELVVWTDGGVAATGLLEMLRSGAGATAFHTRCLPAASVAVDESVLERFWAPVRTRLEWMVRAPQARRCLAALMEFAADHLPSALRSLQVPTAWIADGDVRLGNAALEQLGVLSLRGDGDRQCLLGILDQCRSVGGRRLLRSRLLRPISDITELNRRLDMVDRACGATPDLTARTEKALRSFYDMSRLWRRMELGSATVGDMACLLRSYAAAADLLAVWPLGPEGGAAWCAEMAGTWSADVLTDMAREGQSVPVVDLPCRAGVPAEIVSGFAVGSAIRTEAHALVTAWSAMGRGEPLYLADAEGGGFRVTGTKRRISAVLTALRDGGDTSAEVSSHKTSAALENSQLRDLSARHRNWWHSWSATWVEFWAAIQAAIVTRGRNIHRALELWCAELDLAWTAARIATEWLWRRPVFVADAAAESWIAVERLRHPLLERLTTVPYVPHTLVLGGDGGGGAAGPEPVGKTSRGLLLYGMNAAGKSSLMKAVGLCVVLAQCGFPVPAASCRLSPFTALFTRILGNDNLWAGLSSFAVEMTEFREILRFADARSLVLGDELCAGTESLSATALVAAGVETLAGRGTKFVFATHLHELATMPDIAGHSGVRAVHLRVHYDAASDRLVYDRELAAGSGSALYGLEVCRALDLPVSYLDRAMSLRSQLAGVVAAAPSVYSAGAVVRNCAVCGGHTGLETHHIRPQADAAAAAAEGFAIHGVGNLVCLCTGCHDDHHAGRLHIQGWEDSSAGRRLKWSRPAVAVTGGCAAVAVTGGCAAVAVTGCGSAAIPTSSVAEVERLTEEIVAWIREQRRLKIPMATIKRVARTLFGGIELTTAEIRGIKLA